MTGGWGSLGRRLAGWRLYWAVTAALMVALGTVLASHPGLAGVHLVIRVTARSSLVLFLAAFTASAVWRLWPGPWSRWQIANRRYLGLAFAASHAMHLGGVIAFARLAPAEFREATGPALLWLGGLAYLVLLAMTVTSFEATTGWIGRRAWNLLHTAGSYYLWLIFSITYALNALEQPAYAPAPALLALALGVRLAARRARVAASASTTTLRG